jgi:signal transduction histidine kinase
MNFASDQSDAASRQATLSPLAQQLLQVRETVMSSWANAVQLMIPPARVLYEPLLIDTLPAFFDNLVQSLSPGYPRGTPDRGNNVAAVHGDERARLTHYAPGDVVREYQLFRNVLLAVCVADGIALQPSDIATINDVVDAAVQQALAAYVRRQSDQRERYVMALAHDIRNPLQNIGMAAQLIQAHKPAPEVSRLAERITTNVAATDTLIREILDDAAACRADHATIEFTPLDMLALAREVAATVPGERVTVQGEPVTGYWSPPHLRRALANLLANAVKYGDGSVVAVQVGTTRGTVVVSVHNGGPPIPPERIDQMLLPFHRGGAGDGWGLGLHFVRRIAECHAGSITLDSSPERGTTVVMDMPVDPRPVMGATAS